MSNPTPNNPPERPEVRRAGNITLTLIAVNVAVFIFQNAAEQLNLLPVYSQFALSLTGLGSGHIWQLISFQFLHLRLIDGGAFHLLGNLFLLHVFGSAVEQALGGRKFLGLYLLSGTVGGLLQISAGWLAPEQFGTAVVGASAGACGLLAAHATLFPRERLHFFFLPVTVRNDVLLSLVIAVTITSLFLPSVGIAHCAHLGGIMTGFVLVRAIRRPKLVPASLKCPLNSGVPRSYN